MGSSQPFRIILSFLLVCCITSSIHSQTRFADAVVSFSSQYSTSAWSAQKILGAPDVYPMYGDNSGAWAHYAKEGGREYIELSFANPGPIQNISVYETYNPGAIDTLYVKNPATNQWIVVWSGTAAPLVFPDSRIFIVTFPLTAFNVSQVRIAINSDAVPGWNEYDAVAISSTPISLSLPDLAAMQLQVPTEAWTNQTIDVTWQVTNTTRIGTGATQWTDRVYLSPTPTLDPASVAFQADQPNVSALAPGESYTRKASIVVPRGLKGNYYFYVMADINHAVAESLETNNLARSAPILLHQSPEPDLMAVSLDAPRIAFAGDSALVRITAKNIAKVTAVPYRNWVDQFFLSQDTVLDISNAIALEGYQHPGELAADSSYSGIFPVLIPRTLTGAYYVYVYIDRFNILYENLIESNNIRRFGPIQIVNVRPVLQVTSATVPASGLSGKAMQIEWTIHNAGAGATYESSWSDRVYCSLQPQFNPNSAKLIGTFPHRGRLEPDGSYHVVQSVILPNGISGLYYFYVQADCGNEVFELSTPADRILRSPQGASISLSPWPDLRVQSVSIPAGATAGREASVSWTVENKGSVPTPSVIWNDRIYLSRDSTMNSSAVLLGEVPALTQLAAGAVQTRSKIVTLPPTLAGKLYCYVRADADDVVFENTDESNNTGRSAALTVAHYPEIDLAVTSVTVPDTLGAGEPVDVKWIVRNAGSGRTLFDLWYDAIYLSKYAVFNPDSSMLLKRALHEGALNPSDSYMRTLQVTVPNGLAGKYYVYAAADVEKQSGDSSAANNVRSAAAPSTVIILPRPDLTVTSVRLDDSVFAGQPTLVRWTVRNSSAGPVQAAGWYDAVYLSANGQADKDAFKLDSHFHNGPLQAFASYSDSMEVIVPLTLAGAGSVLVKTDILNAAIETNETNNVGGTGSVLRLAAPSDLVVTSAVGPASAEPGNAVIVTYTVHNQGANTAKGWMTDAVYLSSDKTWDAADPMLGTHVNKIEIAPGGVQQTAVRVRVAAIKPDDYAGTAKDELPGISPGAYHLIVRTDIRNNIVETVDDNNSYVSGSVINVDVEKLQRNVTKEFSLRNGQSRYYAITAQADEDILVSLDGGTQNGAAELFVRYADVPSRGMYDYLYQVPYALKQQLTISSSKAGTYFILVRGLSLPADSMRFTITAKTLQLHIDSVVSPIAGIGGEATVQINGAKFKPGAIAQLRRAGSASVYDNSHFLASSAVLIARFPTEGMAEGAYDMAVINTDGQEAVLPNAFTLQKGDPAQLLVAFAGPNRMRINAQVPLNIVAYNPTNLNIQRALLQFKVRKEMKVWVETDASIYSPAPATWNLDSLVDNEGNRVFTVYLYNVAPRQTKTIRMLIEPTQGGRYIFTVDGLVFDRVKFDSLIVVAMREAIRQGWVHAPGTTTKLGKTTEACPYDDAGACEAWNQRERNIDISKDLPGLVESGLDVADVTEIDRDSAWKLGKFVKNLLDFFNKWKNSSGYAADAAASLDPNDLVGPAGYGDSHWVSVSQTLPYTIHFENDPARATAPAQSVTVTMDLDTTVNANSFRLGNFGFAGRTYTDASGRGYHTQRLDCRDSLGVFVDVSAGVDVEHNKVFWSFKSVEPGTGALPSDPMTGMLPVNDALHHGEGFVSYTIRPKASAKTRDIISPKAVIIFDTNAPIATPSLFNTIDAGMPVSSVLALAPVSGTGAIPVRWTGRDDSTGSGIKNYSVYISKNDSAFTPWLTNVRDTVWQFSGLLGSRYRFFSVAADNAGNVESMKAKPEASVFVTGVGTSDEPIPAAYSLEQNFPNPFNPSTTIRFGLKDVSDVRIDIYNILGQRVTALDLGRMNAGMRSIKVDMSGYSSGIYFYRIDAIGAGGEQFIAIRKMLMLK